MSRFFQTDGVPALEASLIAKADKTYKYDGYTFQFTVPAWLKLGVAAGALTLISLPLMCVTSLQCVPDLLALSSSAPPG